MATTSFDTIYKIEKKSQSIFEKIIKGKSKKSEYSESKLVSVEHHPILKTMVRK